MTIMKKQSLYSNINKQLQALLENEDNTIANMANASALLFMSLQNINWAGFYLVHQSELILGPFQGKPACVHIPIGSGVCGACATSGKIQRIHNVHTFPGHIACDNASISEIVIPIYKEEKLFAVLDIDSPIQNHFDQYDEEGLKTFVDILEQHI